MTSLVDEVARVLRTHEWKGVKNAEQFQSPDDEAYWKESASAAIAVFAKWLREPSDGTLDAVMRQRGVQSYQDIFRALADHIERDGKP